MGWKTILFFMLLIFLVACDPITKTNTEVVGQKVTPSPTIDPTELAILEPQKGMEQGVRIVEAIEKYFSEKDEYPGALSELVPHYIKEIPVTLTGQIFQYQLSEIYVYILSFDLLTSEDVNGYCSYVKKYSDWECGVYAEH